MIRYTVVRHPDARDELVELWISARDRNAIAAAADFLDVELSQDAGTKGVDVAEGLRAFYSAPLRALFAVGEDDRIVEVLRVKRL